MPVTVKVNGTDNTLVHKGSMGMAKCTAPDVCKTPSPGGPVPVPYPVILSLSSDLESGTTTVTADGGNMCAIKGSDFSRCSGDEAGTAGGVKSNVNMKEATWILYSFDVKMDGANACRKTDKMMMNHENTICMNGEDQMARVLKELNEMACECAQDYPYKEYYPPGHEKEWLNCTITGINRHSCVAKKLADNKPGETGVHPGGGANYDSGALPPGQAYCRPDVVITAPGVRPPIAAPDMKAIVELKFQCNPDGKLKPQAEWDPAKVFGAAQRKCYEKIKLPGGKQKPGGVRVDAVGPTEESCK
jgi:hypothetical protein